MANRKNGGLYVGVTSNLVKRVYEHKTNAVAGFTQKYHVHLLVYYEMRESMMGAIAREKHLKKWNREWKIRLIEEENPEWKDLYSEIIG